MGLSRRSGGWRILAGVAVCAALCGAATDVEARRRKKRAPQGPTLGRKAPPQAQKHYEAGLKLVGEAQFEEAAKELRAALALMPDSAKLVIELARALERADQLEEAVRWYNRYLSLAPGGKDVPDVLRLVGQLEEMAKAQKEQARREAEAKERQLREWAETKVKAEREAAAAAEAARQAAEAAASAEQAAAAPPPEEEAGSPWWLVPLAGAVLAAGAATWVGLTAWDQAEEAAGTPAVGPYAEARQAADDAATLSSGLWIGAGVLAATSGVLLVVGSF